MGGPFIYELLTSATAPSQSKESVTNVENEFDVQNKLVYLTNLVGKIN